MTHEKDERSFQFNYDHNELCDEILIESQIAFTGSLLSLVER